MAAGFPLQSNASCRALAISSLFQRILTGRKVLLSPGLDQYVAHEIVFPSCMAVRRSASTAARCLCHQAAAYFVNTAGENGERGRRELRLPGGHDDGARCSNGGRRLGRRTSLRRVSIHAAHAGIAACTAGAGGHPGGFGSAVGVRREGRMLLLQVPLTAGWTLHLRNVRRPAHQLLKLGTAILAKIFVNRHD